MKRGTHIPCLAPRDGAAYHAPRGWRKGPEAKRNRPSGVDCLECAIFESGVDYLVCAIFAVERIWHTQDS